MASLHFMMPGGPTVRRFARSNVGRGSLEMLAPGGTVTLVELRVNEQVEQHFALAGRLYCAASTTICCAHAISEGGKLVLGAQAGRRVSPKCSAKQASRTSARG